MSDDVLLRFVTKNLIDVAGDDTKLTSLRQAAGDLSGILKETPAKTLAFSLTAFDPEVPEDDPSVIEAADALRGRWETYANTFSSMPIAVCRAMLLDALIHAALDNEAIAIGFAASARNVLPFMEVGGEREIWAEVVAEIEKGVEERAESEWAIPASINLPEIKLDAISFDEILVSSQKVDKNILAKNLRASAGPNYHSPKDGNHVTGGNQYFPSNNDHWVYEFGMRAATSIAKSIDETIESLSVEGAGLSGATNALVAAISAHLATTVQAVSGATMGLQRRAGLLWWKEALFSPSARRSYRDMPAHAAALLMAFDMYRQIPAFSPVSVAAFLRETIEVLPNINKGQKVSIRELVKEAGEIHELVELRTEAARLVPAPVGRGPLLGLIGHPETLSQADDRGFRDLVGIKPDTELSISDWSVWLLREFQAVRTITEAPLRKPRTTSRKRASRK